MVKSILHTALERINAIKSSSKTQKVVNSTKDGVENTLEQQKEIFNVISEELDGMNLIVGKICQDKNVTEFQTSYYLSELQALYFTVGTEISDFDLKKQLQEQIKKLELRLEGVIVSKKSNKEAEKKDMESLIEKAGKFQEDFYGKLFDEITILSKQITESHTITPLLNYKISKSLHSLSIKFSTLISYLDALFLGKKIDLADYLFQYNHKLSDNPASNNAQSLMGVLKRTNEIREGLLKEQSESVKKLYDSVSVAMQYFDKLDSLANKGLNKKENAKSFLDIALSFAKDSKVGIALGVLAGLLAISYSQDSFAGDDSDNNAKNFDGKIGDSTLLNSDVLSYSINFSTNPTSAFDLGEVSDFSKDEISTLKKVPGVRVSKGKVTYTPSKTLDYLKSQKAIYESDLKRVFANNSFLIKHFQFYLNSKLGLNGNTFSGVIDKNTITKTSSVLKNESIFNAFDNVLASYGPSGLRVFNMNGKTVLVNTNLGNFSDKDALAILDMPYFDENGETNFSNEFNELLLDFPTEGFSYIAGLNDNKVRLITSKWLEAVNTKLSNVKYEGFDLQKATDEKQAEEDKIKKELEKTKKSNSGPTILSGRGQVLSGNLSDKSALGLLIRNNTLGLNHQDEISLDKVNIKTTLEFIAEATNKGDNSRVAAKLIMLYSMARVGTTIYMEKGDQTSKFGVGATYMTDAGNIIKLDYGFFKKFMEYTFPEVNKKYNLAPEQHGLSLSYTQQDIEKFEMLKELTYSLRAFKVETIDVGEVGKLTRDVNNIFEQYKVLGALQGGTKLEAEVNFGFDLGKALSEEMGLMDIRLDVAPRVGYTKYDDVLDIKGESKFGAGLRTKLSTLLFDKTVKASISSDIYTGGIYSYGIELSKKMEFGEASIYAKQDKFGPDTNALNSIGIKGTFENPFGLQDIEEKDVPTYTSLFSENQKQFKFLTYEQADFDQKLVSGYAIAPKVQIQKIRELMIDRSALPAGSTLEKNDDGTLKQINLNSGVNDLNGTINVAPASYLSHFSITGTSFVTVKNVEKMAVPQVYNIAAGQTSGGFVIMTLPLTKGSVILEQLVKYLANVPENLKNDFLNGTKTFEQIQALMGGIDTQPNAFDIVNMTNQARNTSVTTNAVTVGGINTSVAASTTVGTIVKNGTDTGLTSTTVVSGDTVAVKLTTSGSFSTAINGTLTIGTGATSTDNFSVTTEAADTTPNAFTFTDLTGQALSTLVESNAITVGGTNTTSAISVVGGEYSINGGAWTSLAGTVTSGQIVKVRHTTSGVNSTTVNTILTIGGVSDTFSTTTEALVLDTTPPSMEAMSVTGITDTTGQLSATIDEAGTGYYIVQASALGTPSVAQIMAGQDSTGASAVSFGNSAMAASTNHTFNISGLTPSTNYKVYFIAKDNASTPNVQASPTSLNLNTVATPADTTPDAFDIVDMTNQSLNTPVTTNAVTVSGVSSAVTASTTVGTLVVNGTDTLLTSTTVYNTDTVAVKLTTSASYSTAINGTLTIGTLSDNFSVTTLSADVTPPATPNLSINSGANYTNSTSVSINITGDTDNVGVTGWYVSESSSTPTAGAGGWSPTEPTTATISSGDNTKTLYVWTKDAQGNVSSAGSDTIVLDTTSPTIISFSGTTPNTKTTQYNGLTLNLGEDLTGGTITSLTSSNGGTLTNVGISGGNVVFDWLTPNAGGTILRAVGTDKAGNAFDITLNVSLPNSVSDITPPSAPTLTSTPEYTNQNSVGVEVNGEVGSQVWVNGSNSGSVVSGTGKVSINLDTSGVDGTKNFTITLKDSSGNESNPLNVSIIKDTTSPDTMSFTIDSITPDTKTTQYNGLKLYLGEDLIGGATLTSLTSSTGGTISGETISGGNIVFNWLTPNAGGTILRAVGTDKAGNAFDVNLSVTLPN